MGKFRPTFSGILALVAIFCSLGGGAYAAGQLLIRTSNIRNGAVTASKLAPSVRRVLTLIRKVKTNGGVSIVTVQGPKGDPGQRGPAGYAGAPGAQGAPGAPSPSSYASMTVCQPQICMESSNGSDKGGWYIGGQRVTDIPVGDVASFQVAVEQPTRGGAMGENGTGEISVTYDTKYFQFVSDSQGDCSIANDSLTPWYEGQVSCDMANLDFDEEIDTFQFKALAADPVAMVSADALLWGTASGPGVGTPDYTQYAETSGIFPVQIG